MKHKKLLLALIAIVTVMISTSAVIVVKNHKPSLFTDNIMALTERENPSGMSICYSQFTFHFTKRVLICGKCDYAWGFGTEEGGLCFY